MNKITAIIPTFNEEHNIVEAISSVKFADEIIVNSLDFKGKFKKRFNLKTLCIYNPLNKKEIIIKSKTKPKIKFSKKKNKFHKCREIY